MSQAVFPEALLDRLRQARRVVVLTGAGISAESGIPTFRDALTGLWAQYNPKELATPEAFQRNPRLVWEWYEWRVGLIRDAQPNPGHRALAKLEKLVPDLTLITQNIDSLHQAAGSSAVIELHGNLRRYKCSVEGRVLANWPSGDSTPPLCPNCGAFIRHDVVWFGENLPEQALSQAVEAAGHSDLFLSIGTSSLVQPAASLPLLALKKGALLVEVNLDETPLSQIADVCLRGPAGVVLPALLQAAWPEILL